jgi:hypothetical protein
LAVKDHNKETIGAILKARANVNARNSVGKTPLHVANARRKREIVDLLLKGGADPNAKDTNGQTPLHSWWDGAEIIELLLGLAATPGRRTTREARRCTQELAGASLTRSFSAS